MGTISQTTTPNPSTSTVARTGLNSILTDDQWFYDPIIVCIVLGVLTGIGLNMWDVFHNHIQFDFEKFGNGVAFILGAGGVGYGAKRFGERRGRDDGDSTTVSQS
ncbi:MAG: hypothetical protein ACYC9R_06490 [Nitrosotalea sp.]